MGEMDKAEKILESYNDVFADIVNVLLFNGEQVVREQDLEDQTPVGYYKASGEVREQERDIAKRWINGRFRIASYGIENQTLSDRNMPVRVLSYDAADLHAQLLKGNEYSKLYPVVTLVLYYGYENHWRGPRNLKERLTIPDRMKPLVFDYGMHLFEIAYLTREQVDMFRSDFRIVADYCVQKRENRDYVPSRQQMHHVREILHLLKVMELDDRFEEVYNESVATDKTQRGEIRNMCDVLDKVCEQAIRAERAKMDRVMEEARVEYARNMKAVGLSLGQIAAVLDMDERGVAALLNRP